MSMSSWKSSLLPVQWKPVMPLWECIPAEGILRHCAHSGKASKHEQQFFSHQLAKNRVQVQSLNMLLHDLVKYLASFWPKYNHPRPDILQYHQVKTSLQWWSFCNRHGMKRSTRSTQHCIPPGSLNPVVALIVWSKDGNVTSTGW